MTAGCAPAAAMARLHSAKAAVAMSLLLLFVMFGIQVIDKDSRQGRRWSEETAGGVNEEDEQWSEEAEGDVDNETFRTYEIWDSSKITAEIRAWAESYPNLLHVTTSQQAFRLASPGSAADCPFEAEYPSYTALGVGCRTYILTIQDFVAHPEGSESSKYLPEVFWSGALHGDERVGPTAVLEAARLLLEATTCEALPRITLQQSSTSTPTSAETQAWQNELERAQECRMALEQRYGLNDASRQWLARLVTTRRIVIVPTANALGYHQNNRTEGGIDPNRDFPYDLSQQSETTSTLCMQSIAARTLNEVFREHLFQMSLTFHSGIELIGYEWGSPHWLLPNDNDDNGDDILGDSARRNPASPDDTAQAAIAQALSRYGSGWNGTRPYNSGAMNDILYPVEGGMEDWAYAGSWDVERVKQCEPTTYGEYPANKTVYDNSTLRVFNMLVETSNDKQPIAELGTSQDILGNSTAGNGHISRNIRLSLLAAELVEPYVAFRSVNSVALMDDLVPLMNRNGTSCQTTHAVLVPIDSKRAHVQYEVGGALTVDQTSVYYAKWDASLEAALSCDVQPDWTSLSPHLKLATVISNTTGSTRLASNSSMTAAEPPLFLASIDLDGFAANDRIAVVAVARVDQAWGAALPGDVLPKVPPQSHMANARTDPLWYHTTADGSKIIQGRLDWASVPLTLVLDQLATNTTPAFLNRYSTSLVFPTESPAPTSADGSPEKGAADTAVWNVVLPVVVGVMALSAVIGMAYFCRTARQSRHKRTEELFEVEEAVK